MKKSFQKKSIMQGCPRIARGLLGLFLCIVILISFPFSVFAYDVNEIGDIDLLNIYYTGSNGNVAFHTFENPSFPCSFFDSTIKRNQVNYVEIEAQAQNVNFSKNDNFTFYTTLQYGIYQSIGSIRFYIYDTQGKLLVTVPDNSYSYENLRVTANGKIKYNYEGTIRIKLVLNNITLSVPTADINADSGFGLTNMVITTSDDSGLLDTIIGWLRTIKDNMSTFMSNVGLWITSIKENLNNTFSTWFNNLSNWLTTVKEAIVNKVHQISDWLSSLGDRIGNFFINIWNNFTNWWSGLWTVDDNFSSEYRNRWDNWLSNHFGALYESTQIISDVFVEVSDIISSDDIPSAQLVIPDIKLPSNLTDKRLRNIVILDGRTIYFNDMFGNNSNNKTTIEFLRMIVHMMTSILFVIAFIFVCKRKFDKVIAGREVS